MMLPTPELELADDTRRVMRYLTRSDAPSRLEISEALDINPGVITRYCKELLSLGFITEDDAQRAPGRGRPSVPIRLNGSGAYAIGIAVHLGWADIVVANLEGDILAKSEMSFHDSDVPSFGADLSSQVDALRAELRLTRSRFLGFGLAVPGFSVDGNAIRHTVDRLRTWRHIDLSAKLSEILDGPVWVENDGNASALAEYYRRRNPGATDLFAIHIGYGVGGGSIAAGQLFRGAHHNAAEIGSLFPLSKPRPSALDLLTQMQASGFEGDSLKALFLDSPDHDEIVLAWVKRASKQLELAVNAGVAFYDPAEIVISGMLPNKTMAALADSLNRVDWKKRLDDRPLAPIRASELNGLSASLGAAMVPIHATLF